MTQFREGMRVLDTSAHPCQLHVGTVQGTCCRHWKANHYQELVPWWRWPSHDDTFSKRNESIRYQCSSLSTSFWDSAGDLVLILQSKSLSRISIVMKMSMSGNESIRYQCSSLSASCCDASGDLAILQSKTLSRISIVMKMIIIVFTMMMNFIIIPGNRRRRL